MATNFPSSLDTLTNPAAGDPQNNPSHSAQHANANDSIEALEAKVGINSSAVTTSHDYKLGEVTGTDKAVGKTATQTLENKTLTAPIWDGWSNFPKNSGVDLVFSATDANTISVAGYDLTGVIQKGDKIKLTNDGAVKYYYVSTTPAFSTNTTFDVAGEVDLVATAEVTSPYFSKIDNPQGFKKGELWYISSAYMSGSQNINDNSATKVAINTKSNDPNNNFDTSNYRYVAPITGKYYFNFMCAVTSGTGKLMDVFTYIRKNGSIIANGGGFAIIATGTYSGKPATGLFLSLNKGDYIELFALGNTNDGSQTTVAEGRFESFFVSV